MRAIFFILLTLTPLYVLSGVDSNQAFEKLKSGHMRFLEGEPFEKNIGFEKRKKLKYGQNPFVTILSCSDSRVPSELVFHQGLGDLFIVRLAGNVLDTIALESIEFGVINLKTPLLLVLGHTKCGAVKAAIAAYKENPEGQHIKMISEIIPAVAETMNNGSEDTLLERAIEQNVRNSAHKILQNSSKIRQQVSQGNVKLVMGVYDIASGEVKWLNE